MTILGISLGTRTIGVAVLKRNELIIWETHAFAGPWSPTKLRIILLRYERLMARHGITNIAIKVPPVTHHTSGIKQILKGMQALAKQFGLNAEVWTKEDLKLHAHLSHMNSLIEYVLLQYPILRPVYIKQDGSKRYYHIKMFEAVLAAQQYKLIAKRNN